MNYSISILNQKINERHEKTEIQYIHNELNLCQLHENVTCSKMVLHVALVAGGCLHMACVSLKTEISNKWIMKA